jgi:uroporphyrinogen decarboxylase
MTGMDLESFWARDEQAHVEKCFSANAPQVALGIRMSEECIFAELQEEGNPWGYTPRERMMELSKRYNDKSEKIVGRRLLPEYILKDDERFPEIRNIGEVFGGKVLFNGVSEWLMQSCNNPVELEELLNAVNKTDLRSIILPANWEGEKKRIYEQYGKRPDIWRGVRGPVTLAMSIYGTENLIYLIMDSPDLAAYYSETIYKVIKGYIDIMDEEAGYTYEDHPHGFWFSDDECCLLNPEMYEFFGYPILKKVFQYVSPDTGDTRYQHSDSPMAHILPILSRLDLTGCNFGPTLTIDQIRGYLPHACIDGQIAPFTFMSNDEAAIIAEVKRDCEMAKRNGRGVCINTAGSINNGSLLTSMRAVMAAIVEYGQY